jgi:hypothetical protein
MALAKKYISIQQGMKLRKPSISSCLSFFLSASIVPWQLGHMFVE